MAFLFLDEIGEIGHDIQILLLRALENRTYQRVGDTKELTLEAHLVFATNKNLEEAVNSGEIREDFFQRISALTFVVPPLRDRLDDILTLTKFFFENSIHASHPLANKTIQEAFTEEALRTFYDYDWPGNIRELRRTVQRLLFDAEMKDKDLIDLSLLPDRLTRPGRISTENKEEIFNPQAENIQNTTDWSTDKLSAYAELKRIEKALIIEGGRKLEAAQRLGLKNDQTLRYRVKKYYNKYPELFEEYRTILKVYRLNK